MALGDPYVTAEELKEYAKVGDSVDDILIGQVVNAVSRSIERNLGRQFNDAGSATARTFYPARYDCVRVDDFSTTTGLVVKSDTANDGTFGTTISSSYYTAWPLDGIVDGQTGHPFREVLLHNGQRFVTYGQRPTVQVTARWGWTAVPADIKQATYIQAARVLSRRESVHGVLGAGDFVVRVDSRLDPDVAEMIRHYRIQTLVA